MTSLGAGTAYGINLAGQVVGKNGNNHAFLYSSGTMKDLGTLSGYATSAAQGINAGGQVVGYATTSTGGTQAFLYTGGSMTGLGAPTGDTNSTAVAINSAGQIVGYARPSNGFSHAFLYSGGTMTDLGTLSGDTISEALGVNELGQVVGYSGGRAFLDSGGTMTDLNSLVDPNLQGTLQDWTLQEALGINQHQQIVALGTSLFTNVGEQHAVLLSPEYLPGDANLDGKVDINDLTIVLANFGQNRNVVDDRRLQRRWQGRHQRSDDRAVELRHEHWHLRPRRARRRARMLHAHAGARRRGPGGGVRRPPHPRAAARLLNVIERRLSLRESSARRVPLSLDGSRASHSRNEGRAGLRYFRGAKGDKKADARTDGLYSTSTKA